MINRATRILTRWMRSHPQYGMRPLLDAVTFDSADEETSLLILPGHARLPLDLYNDVDDECIAKRYDPDTVPALAIVAELSTEAPVKWGKGILDFEISVSFAYLERDEPVNQSRQRGGYVLTAVADSLRAFNEPLLANVAIPVLDPVAAYADTSATWRELGDVRITEVTSLKESRVTGGVGTSTLIGTMLATFKVRRTVVARLLP